MARSGSIQDTKGWTEIGKGTYSVVYRPGNKPIAIKDFKYYYVFHREALITNLFRSPSLISFKLLDFKYCRAEMDLYKYSLSSYINNSFKYDNRYTSKGISERQRIIRDIFKGLNYIHSMGLVHADLSPNNILLSSMHNPKVVIADFGSIILSDTLSGDNTTYTVCSPDKFITPAHDYYAVGRLICMMYDSTLLHEDTKDHKVVDLDLIPEDFQELVIGLLGEPKDRCKVMNVKGHPKSVIDTQMFGVETKYHNHIMDIINKCVDTKINLVSFKALDAILRQLDGDIYHALAFVYLALSLIDVAFDYDIVNKDFISGCDQNDWSEIEVKKQIEHIIMNPEMIKRFIQYHLW